MKHQFNVQVDATMVRQAWNAWFFSQGLSRKLLLAMPVCLGLVFWDLRDGQLRLYYLIMLCFLTIITLIFGVGYFIGRHRALDKLEMIAGGKVSYTFSETAIEAVSSMGSVSLAWPVITEVRRYHGLILLGFRGATYSSIPEAQIPPEALSFLIDEARRAGAKITNL
ncbi:MAG: hypothetical protein KDK97_08455 [Verrucomicrobiales bacterium]|nr:hypothetical protein [Verrucomicrobiales bacterium]MCP5558136.1 hypothetical protein [Verrucomicrobiaceae bacterium]